MAIRTSSTAVAAGVVAIAFWLYSMAGFLVASDTSWQMPVVFGGSGLVAIGLMVLCRRWPLPAVLLIGMCLALGPAAVGAGFVAQAVAANRHGRSSLVVLTGGWLVLAKVVQLLAGPYHRGWSQASAVELVVAVSGLVIATLTGWLARSVRTEHASRDDAEVARREAELVRTEQVRLSERERIAREMHDVLAHRISLVAMHSGALAYRDDLDPEVTRETARVIQQNSRAALGELRLVLSRLRTDGQAPEPPQPTLAELPTLVAEARGTGQRIDLQIVGNLDQLAPQVDRSVFRILQEALTNARKHAPGAPVSVRIDSSPGSQLVIMVRNPISGLALPDSTGAGLGLVGVNERVELLGGTTLARERAGRFELIAKIPAAVAFPRLP